MEEPKEWTVQICDHVCVGRRYQLHYYRNSKLHTILVVTLGCDMLGCIVYHGEISLLSPSDYSK